MILTNQIQSEDDAPHFFSFKYFMCKRHQLQDILRWHFVLSCLLPLDIMYLPFFFSLCYET